jgi:phage shock protein C
MKRLYRSSDNKVFAGVFGGLGEYFDVDPVVLRLAFVFVMLATAVIPGLIAYAAAIFIVPARQGGQQS